MSVKFSNIVKRFRKCESGATLVEYGIAIVLAVGVGTGALVALGGAIETNMNDAIGVMSGTDGTSNEFSGTATGG